MFIEQPLAKAVGLLKIVCSDFLPRGQEFHSLGRRSTHLPLAGQAVGVPVTAGLKLIPLSHCPSVSQLLRPNDVGS